VTELSEPFVPADLDLRDFRWMKLDLVALFNSDFNAIVNDTAWRAAVTLWGKAWHQVPAGSLPDDDARLCGLAGLGRDLRTWRKIKADALHGFVKCSDDRLYHRFLCGMAVEAAAEHAKSARRREQDRVRKSGGRSAGIPQEFHDGDGGNSEGDAAGNGSDSPFPPSSSPPHPPNNYPPSTIPDKSRAETTRACAREDGSLSEGFQIPEKWIEAGAATRTAAGLPAVPLKPEAVKLQIRWAIRPPQNPYEEWLGWALKARADLVNGAATSGPGPPDVPTGPPPPLPNPH
jgi:hypothetical protein